MTLKNIYNININHSEFFNIYDWWEHIGGFDPANLTGQTAFFVTSPRNMGKTYNGLNEIAIPFSLNYDQHLAIIGNNELQARMLARGLFAYVPERNLSIDDKTGIIYELPTKKEIEQGLFIAGLGKEHYMVGRVASINNAVKAKGVGWDKVNIMIYDEFNEPPDPNKPWDLGIKKQYRNLLDILFSIGRTRNWLLLAYANRNDINNEFFVRFGIDRKYNPEYDYMEEISVTFEGEKHKLGYWIEVGFDSYRTVENKKTFSFLAGQLDRQTRDFYNGKYMGHKLLNVVNWNRYVEPTYHHTQYIALNPFDTYAVGTFEYEGEIKLVMTDDYVENLENSVVYGVHTASGIRPDTKQLYVYQAEKVMGQLIKDYKAGRLYFTNNEIVTDFMNIAFTYLFFFYCFVC